MDKEKFPFGYDGNEYILWAWKGDYLNLGAGAEMGIYDRMGDTEHWLVKREPSMPMTLTLAQNEGNTIVDYDPNEKKWYHELLGIEPNKKHWWITGFNPHYQDRDADNLTATYTVDFSDDEDMFDSFSKNWYGYENEDGRWEFDKDNHIATFIFGKEEQN